MVLLKLLTFVFLTASNQEISIRPKELDLGYFPHDAAIRLEYEIINPTRYPLKILKAMPFCSCLSIVRYDSIIYPFSKGRVIYIFKSHKMSGWFRKEILIKTDRFDYQYLRFAIRGTVCDPPTKPKVLKLKNNTAQAMIYNSFWGGYVQLLSKPKYCWVGLKKGKDTQLLLHSPLKNLTGGIRLSIGRKVITLPIEN